MYVIVSALASVLDRPLPRPKRWSHETIQCVVQVWDLESFACVQTLEHEGVPVQLIEIAGTRLHTVAGRTVRTMLRSPPHDALEHSKCRCQSMWHWSSTD